MRLSGLKHIVGWGILTLCIFTPLFSPPVDLIPADQKHHTSTGSSISLRLTTPPYQIRKAGDGSDQILIDGYGRYAPEGEYMLPRRVYNLALPPDADLDSLRLAIERQRDVTLGGTFQPQVAELSAPSCLSSETVLIRPGSQNLGMCSAPSLLRLSQWGTSNEVNNSEIVRLLRPGQMRKWRFVRLEYSPFRYSPVDSSMELTKEVTVRLYFDHLPQAAQDKDYVNLINDDVLDHMAVDFFDNYETAAAWYRDAVDANPTSSANGETYDYVIITTNAIVANSSKLADFVDHKEDHGHSVWVVTEDVFNTYPGPPPDGTAERIRAFLQANYISHGFHYVLLIGDPDPDDPYKTVDIDFVGDIPMKMCNPNLINKYGFFFDTPTDYYYADLSSTWNPDGDIEYCSWNDYIYYADMDMTPEVIVGRIPLYQQVCPDYGGLDKILQKIIDYQNGLYAGDWKNNVLLPMAFHALDFDTAGLAEQAIDDYLAPLGFNSWKMYQQGNSACAPDSVYASNAELLGGNSVLFHWQSPLFGLDKYGLVLWWGHGSETSTMVGFDHHEADGSTIDCSDGVMFNTWGAPLLDDKHPAIVFQNSCNNGYPERPNNLQHWLLRNGAAVAVAATRVTWPGQAHEYGDYDYGNHSGGIGYKFIKGVANGMFAGEALFTGKVIHPIQDEMELMNVLGFNLNGDPETRLRVNASVPPPAPSNLVLQDEDPGDMSVTLKWQDNSEIEYGFRIERSLNGVDWDWVASASENSIVNTVAGHACGASYKYRVYAWNSQGDSGYSNILDWTSFDCPPAAPTGLTATPSGVYNENIDLMWDSSPDADGYLVERTVHPFQATNIWTQIGDSLNENYTDDQVSCGETYYYRLVAYNAAGNSSPSEIAIPSAPPCSPNPPSYLVYGVTYKRVTLGWGDDSSNEEGYIVQRKLSGESAWSLLVKLPANSNSYEDDEVLCQVDYDYMVSAYNAGGQASATEAISTDTCPPPTAPSDLETHASLLSETTISLSWTDNSDSEYGFNIERSLDGSSGWTAIGSTGPDEDQFINSDLTCGSTYYYRVRAYNTLFSGYLPSVPGTTNPCDSKAPGHLAASPVSQTQIDLSWVDNAPFGSTNFDIIRTTNMYKQPWSLIASTGAVTSYQDTSLDCSTAYFYRVRARSTNPPTFTSGYTEPISSTTIACTPLAPTSLVTQSITTSSVGFTWTDNSSNETGFKVERYSIALTQWFEIGTTAADEAFYLSSGLACSRRERFRVRAYNAGGNSAYTNNLTVVTSPCQPAAPDGLEAAPVDQTHINLSWNDNSSDEDGFEVQVSDALGLVWSLAGTTDQGVVSFPDSDLACGSDFSYRVFAFNSGGYSPSSSQVMTATQVCTPSLSLLPIEDGLIHLSWSDGSHNESGFKAFRSNLPDSGFVEIASLDPDETVYSDDSALCGEDFYYEVCAFGEGSGNASCSAVQSDSTVCVPATPSDLSATATSDTEIHLEWSDNSGDETGFIILRSMESRTGWIEVGHVGAEVTTFTEIGLHPSRTYFYRILATNDGGVSEYSNLAYAATFSKIYLPLIFRFNP